MTRIAIDASVLVKLYFEEDQSALAKRTVARTEQLFAPDLILAEVANVVWKRCTRREIDADSAMLIIQQILRFPVKLIPSTAILADAAAIALARRCTIYDLLYFAVAIRHSTTLVTADRRFARSVHATEWSAFLRCVDE